MNAVVQPPKREVDHDVAEGPLKRCQISGSEDLHPVLDLGAQPLCDALLDSPDDFEVHYPLSFNVCMESGLGQLGYVLPQEDVYPTNYPYRAGISKPVIEHQEELAAQVMVRFNDGSPNPLVIDIGCNDGTLLAPFKRAGWRALGIEPTDVGKLAAEQHDLFVMSEFFGEDLAGDILQAYGAPLVITMTNVFAHMNALGDVMRGIRKLMDKKLTAVFVVENHYLLDILEGVQFDTVYHEHVRTYSLRSIELLCAQYGLEVFDVERVKRYGGNIRCFIGNAGVRDVADSVGRLREIEKIRQLFNPNRWDRWREAVQYARSQMMEYLYVAGRQGVSFAGCSAPGRASTLINYFGIKRDQVQYLGELADSLKLGKYVPGARIPIIKNTALVEDQPDYVVLFAWHYADVIAERLRREGLTSRLIVPLPEFKVL